MKVDEQGMLDALKAINAASDNKTDDATIESLVPALWSQFQEKLDAIPARADTQKRIRPQTEIMEDLVSQVRGLKARVRDFDPEMMGHGMHRSGSKSLQFYPIMMDEIVMMSKEPGGGDYGLVMLAGMLRDTMPWVSEVLIEAHREMKNASPKQAKKVALALRHTLKFMTRSHFAEMMMAERKQSHMLMMELPLTVERLIDRIGDRHIGEGIDGEIEHDA